MRPLKKNPATLEPKPSSVAKRVDEEDKLATMQSRLDSLEKQALGYKHQCTRLNALFCIVQRKADELVAKSIQIHHKVMSKKDSDVLVEKEEKETGEHTNAERILKLELAKDSLKKDLEELQKKKRKWMDDMDDNSSTGSGRPKSDAKAEWKFPDQRGDENLGWESYPPLKPKWQHGGQKGQHGGPKWQYEGPKWQHEGPKWQHGGSGNGHWPPKKSCRQHGGSGNKSPGHRWHSSQGSYL